MIKDQASEYFRSPGLLYGGIQCFLILAVRILVKIASKSIAINPVMLMIVCRELFSIKRLMEKDAITISRVTINKAFLITKTSYRTF